ncbi:hypothetical protein EPUS_07039 [Endocarpon pusillum Z07020]|uniref:DUF6594 domain-containing protein n=1 Tax=Endocarpon pusillum (strain Z07020 / HMAS-L-300199) TaxID=1263415 RepID=U1GCK5_ENDPU|nr:uncharacterized protein EPUS_07039 [Endocarpon pusillum Z07020]ERF69783.1 hypothetical protein EPUS_07039 [Endocarpon pusillum Z07020]
MLSSRAHTVQERKNRRVAVRRTAMSSRISLLSGITASSSGSSGSGSTVTQESITRPRVRNSKGDAKPKGKRQSTVVEATSTKGKTTPRKSKGAIDVFAFLDKDQSRASLVQKRTKNARTTHQEEIPNTVHDDSDLDSGPQSFHSDSGISINDGGSDHDPSKTDTFSGRRRLGALQEEPGESHHRASFAVRSYRPEFQPIPQEVDEDHPEWYYRADRSPDGDCVPAAVDSDVGSENAEADKPSGYDLLASRLSFTQDPCGDCVPPIYRRFGRLNHRILLQLQDEIAEMEEDLEYMDRADAHERTARHGHRVPASRRLDWRWGGSELHARRLDLLGRIYLKVEQYNQAIFSFQRVASSTSPATTEDIETYHKWMTENKPVVDAEATYLDKKNDLLSLVQQKKELNLKFSTPRLAAIMIAITSATALPILLFRIIPAFNSRVTVILLLAPSAAFLAKSQLAGSLMVGTELRRFLLVYFGALILGALII